MIHKTKRRAAVVLRATTAVRRMTASWHGKERSQPGSVGVLDNVHVVAFLTVVTMTTFAPDAGTTTLVAPRATLGASTDASAPDAMPDAIDPAAPRAAAAKTMRAAPPLK
ncbi:MAG: hypothetical protein ACYCWW_18450 [Deltaproteobacteria bacterium]